MTEEAVLQPTGVTAVNRRVEVPGAAREELRRVYGVALETRRVADMLLRQTMLSLGVDPDKAMFDPESGEIILDGELDKERLTEGIARFLSDPPDKDPASG